MPSDITTRYHEFAPIKHVTAFDVEGKGPVNLMEFVANEGPLMTVHVMAALTPSVHYPRTRITIGCVPLGVLSLTVQQASALMEQIAAARAMVLQSCPVLDTPDDEQLPREVPNGP